MNQLSFIDKIQVLFKLMFSSPIIIGIFIFSMILMILLFFYSKLNKKIMKFIFIIIYVSLIGFAVVKYGSYFLTSIDSFVTLFMANIYFPIIPVYVTIMFISFIIMVVTLNSRNRHRVVKIINTVFFTLVQMLFALFIYIVEVNNIDLSENSNLYSNEQTMTLLELGMGLFVVWIVILLVIFYLKKADKIFRVKNVEDSDDFDEYINDYNEPVTNLDITDERSINESIFETANFDDPIKNLVPEVPYDEEVITFDDLDVPSNSYSVDDNLNSKLPIDNFTNSNVSVFDSFQFLDESRVERKNDDVEIVDFDI